MIDEAMRERLNDPDNDVWVTRRGQEIRVTDLGDQHLTNILRLLLRDYCPFVKAEESLNKLRCAPPSGDAAQDAFDSECRVHDDSGVDAFLPPLGVKMMQEFDDRFLPPADLHAAIEEGNRLESGLVLTRLKKT